MLGFDPLYFLFMIPGLILTMWAQAKVTNTFKKYNMVPTLRGATAQQAARAILDGGGLNQVRIEQVAGDLTDHYDPRTNIIRLSASTHSRATIGAVGVAAHECGHAMQYARGYVPIKIRAAIIPVCNIGSMLSVPVMILGFILNIYGLVTLGIVLFSLVVLFQLVTLPVEFDASRRAIATLESTGMMTPDEVGAVREVLRAAALTYVAALATSLLQLLYYITRARRR